MIKKIAHVCLISADLSRSLNFYEKQLGLKRKFNFMKGGALHGVYLDVGAGSYIEIFQKPDNKVVNTGISHFCLETDNIDGIVASLKACGTDCSEKKTGADHSYQAWVTDPDGNRIEFHEYTAESTQVTGLDCILS